ncbi:YceI-like domain-containing protein [Reichenbachiella faecimaris]|uniref:YceI-like domain-containing protein n=1 Tax=Reichenbachiella faecimaris TaxID=692418 RepID=A0A1W2GN00_REIFA|nr:YceI family protein [Reichenbachiella faecimaris]SMD38039.1 YceI-like domain-containing protein [Reichenbachiella faecimaris]
MKKSTTLLLVLFCCLSAFAQKYVSNQSSIRFYSSAPVEDIEAVNTQSQSAIDLSNGGFAFSIPSNKFQFKKSLMQEHFNENYMESEKYPKATFTGKVKNWSMFSGEQEVVASGDLTIHGETKKVDIAAQLNIQNDQLIVDSVFPIALAEYKIKIPKALFYNIADTVEVTVHFEYKPLTK